MAYSKIKKRNNLFENLINKTTDIALLQETHSRNKNIGKWVREQPGKSFWNSGKISKVSGVGILLKNDLSIKLYLTVKDEEGRILNLNFSIEKQNYQILNIYAPTKNSEKPKFYQQLKKYIEPKQHLILAGHFNMVEDLLLDRPGRNPSNIHKLGFDHLNKVKQMNDLVDIW